MSLFRAFLQTFGVRVVCVVVAAVGSVIVARTLGPEGRGVIAVLGALAGTIVQFGNLGLSTSNLHFSARTHGDAPKLTAASTWVSIVAGSGLGALALLVVHRWPELLPGVPFALLVLTVFSLPFLLASQLHQNVLLGLGSVRAFNAIELLRAGLVFCGVCALAVTGSLSVGSLVLLLTTTAIVVSLSTLRGVSGKAPLSWRLDSAILARAIRYGSIFFLSNTLAFLLLKSDFFLVTYFLGTEEVGIYSVAVQIVDLLLLAPATVAMLLLPRLSAIPNPAERSDVTLRTVRLAAAGMAVACLLVALCGSTLITVLLGSAFTSAWLPLGVLLPGVWLLSVQNILVMSLAAGELPTRVPKLWFLGFGLNVFLNLLFIPRWGLVAAAASSMVAYAFVALGVIDLFRAQTRARWSDILLPRLDDGARFVGAIRSLSARRSISSSR